MTSIRAGRRCVFDLYVHLVFVTKYRKTIFETKHIEALKDIAGKVCKDFGAELKELDGEKDHIHLLVSYSAKTSVSSLVNSLKGVTSRMLRKQFPELEESYCNGQLWSPSYCAASCGDDALEMMKEFIRQQGEPD